MDGKEQKWGLKVDSVADYNHFEPQIMLVFFDLFSCPLDLNIHHVRVSYGWVLGVYIPNP